MSFPAVVDEPRVDKVSIWIIALVCALCAALSFPDGSSAACHVDSSITAKHHSTTVQQRANTTQALRVSTRMGSPVKHQYALVAAATQEQALFNLPYGHGSSVGFLQLIDVHGSVSWRMNISNSAGWFLRGARRVDRQWMTVAQLAQAVQQSGHPDAYAQWVPEARRTTLGYLASC